MRCKLPDGVLPVGGAGVLEAGGDPAALGQQGGGRDNAWGRVRVVARVDMC